MKQRITYFLPEGKRVDSKDIDVGKDTLNFARAHEAAEEWRLTLSLNELPDEVRCSSRLVSFTLLIIVRYKKFSAKAMSCTSAGHLL